MRTQALATPRGFELIPSILAVGLYPVSVHVAARRRRKVPPDVQRDLAHSAIAGESLRDLARKYGVSHETVRRALLSSHA